MKKILAIILATVSLLSLVTLTSCSSSSTLNDKVLVVGVDDSYPPMEYKDPKTGSTIGFDVDMAKEIGKRLGKEVQFKSTLFDGIFTALNTKKFDCVISSISITAARLKGYEFTKPYIANSQMIVVKPDDNSINKAEDLTHKVVGVQLGTTAQESAKTLQAKKIDFTLQTYNEVIEPFADMKAGRVNAIIVDKVVGEYYIGLDKANFKAAALNLTNEPIGICFKKGNTKLRDEVQTQIDAMVKDGYMTKLSIKWFGTDLTSNIDSSLKELK
jgi:polar amino acid transport system substrate-binding protein